MRRKRMEEGVQDCGVCDAANVSSKKINRLSAKAKWESLMPRCGNGGNDV
jgi:hypothetical protein